ncbi:MAG: TIGR04168 family protein [Trichocoleus desertorum ATA4-8-CV12]|jgi:uncharacterized protein (TIGR04168 family)|nr:TIGR04168 family protein [Trichocoleus desertorum ATA4-8-CV12]
MSSQSDRNQTIKIAVIGDVHDAWEAEDGQALKHLGVDLAFFVGDFGNESVEVVRAIAAVEVPKAAIMGNHDAWYSASDWGRKKCPYDRTKEDWVQDQLDLLGETHVGYSKLDFPVFNLTVVGSRPFSWGGSSWKNEQFYRERYEVTSFQESTAKILEAVQSTTHETVIFLGHCGPTGLGDRPEDPCGRDWMPIGGDYGDPDFAAAIAQTHLLNKTVPLVAFGHMHHNLRHTRDRLRTSVYEDARGTVYLNAANVPRIKAVEGDRLRNFSLVSLQAGVVEQASLVWVNQAFEVVSEQLMYRKTNAVAEAV